MSSKNAKRVRRIEGRIDTLEQRFNQCLACAAYEINCRDAARAKANRDRQYRRELSVEYAARHWQTVAYAAIIAAILVLVVAISAVRVKASEPYTPANELMISAAETITHSENDSKNTTVFETSLTQIEVSDEVDANLYDVPLDANLQQLLWDACQESGIDMSLALAVIWQETDFRNIAGDDGDSLGYMQVQQKWHADRMARLGVTDLMDPASNFRVGCDYLAELLERYPLANALSYYNSGSPTLRPQYCEPVMAYMEQLEDLKF